MLKEEPVHSLLPSKADMSIGCTFCVLNPINNELHKSNKGIIRRPRGVSCAVRQRGFMTPMTEAITPLRVAAAAAPESTLLPQP